jgi:hypothetical protein
MLGPTATIGILANPRYTHLMNAAAHRGAHDGNTASSGIAFSRVSELTALHRKAVKRAL